MRQPSARRIVLAAAALVFAGCASPQSAPTSAQTAAKPGAKPAGAWRLSGRAMVSAADVRAVNAALDVMKAGGSAVDAAIAAHAVLGLVEPQSSGLGGGGYMVVYDRATNTVTTFDGRETAPMTATADYFTVDGKNLGFGEAIASGKSVGVPGTVALYQAAHAKYGKLPMASDFDAAIKLADDGFIVSQRLAQSLGPRFQNGPLGKNAESAAYFFPNGKALAVGDKRPNPDYAATLRAIAKDGPAAFYSGQIAKNIVAKVQGNAIPGELSLADLAAYKVRVVPALCGPFRAYRICSAPPSSSGGVAMIQSMGLYDAIAKANHATTQEDKLKAFVLSQQLTYADRDHYVADSDKVTVPIKELIDPKYIAARAGTPFKPGDNPQPGDPGAVMHGKPMLDMWGRDANAAGPGTTQMSFVDFQGNAVSFTDTVEGPFGSYHWTNGFLLNNQLTDFTRPPTLGGKPVANAPGPGKRPRSSMSPTIVFDAKGDLFMVTGSPGGNSIIGYTAKTIAAVIDWGMTAQQASAAPNIVARGQTVRIETSDAKAGANPLGKPWLEALKAAGFKTQEVTGEVSGLNLIVARADHYEGGADPRREGVAIEAVK